MEKRYIIYCHKNKINGKCYIGLTHHSTNGNKRWRDGKGYTAKHHKVFAAAIAKYGWENFEHIILEDNIPNLELANKQEKYWIAKYHSWLGDPNCWGYNATIGGDGTNGHKMSDEEKAWRREQRLGIPLSEETKQKMSLVRRGKPQNMTAKKKVACQKAALAMKKANSKKIKCIETNTVYNSVAEAAKQTGIPKETLSACARGKLKTAWKLHWVYIDKSKGE